MMEKDDDPRQSEIRHAFDFKNRFRADPDSVHCIRSNGIYKSGPIESIYEN